jgi:ABC-type transporter Mla subunit MlaD
MKKIDALVTELDGTSAEVRKFAAALNESLPSLGPKVWNLTDQLEATATNLERASAEMTRMLAENRDGIAGFTRDGLPELERTLREARAAAEQFGELADTLKRDPSQILYRSPEGGVQVPR